ncbi:glycosyltransferase family 2 protein [Shumkonia mesophila]|uniref:glycosyltransferase family 2 protein n=1 Tax=Shumkonia mesophila TaxID=2838854 RepID=UPI002935155C|nr:glycosyltransferase family 2 protein [Shumkonia mesophila]
MNLSIVIPAFQAAKTIPATLTSILAAPLPEGWRLDVVVVDDGSPDSAALASAVSSYPAVMLFRLPQNQGKTKAMNEGIARTTGDVVILLDADDTLVSGWPAVLERVVANWPRECPICFTACRTPDGRVTVTHPDYSGLLSFSDMLAERFSGEYLPMFWGGDLRGAGGYRDPGGLWGCEMLTYLGFAKKHPLWISAEVIRVYYAGRPGSLSDSVMRASGAANVSLCYDFVFDAYGEDYRQFAPRAYRRRRLRQAVFAAIAGEARAMALWRNAIHWRLPIESAAALVLVLSRGRIGLGMVRLGKRLGLLRRFG